MSKIYIDGRGYNTDMVEAFIKESSSFDVHIIERAFEELSKYQYGQKGRPWSGNPERNLIDKKDLIECLMNNYQYPWSFDDLLNKISEIPYAAENHPWIPVNLGMPTKWMKVWVTIQYPSGYLNTEVGKWEDTFKHTNGVVMKHTVVAWMPYYAPEPYQMKEE